MLGSISNTKIEGSVLDGDLRSQSEILACSEVLHEYTDV